MDEDIVYSHRKNGVKVLRKQGYLGDRIKGVFARDMPKTWYVKAANRIKDGDSLEVIEKKNFYNSICSNKKPYFFNKLLIIVSPQISHANCLLLFVV